MKSLEISFTLSLVKSLMGGTAELRFVSTRLRKSIFFFEACFNNYQQNFEPLEQNQMYLKNCCNEARSQICFHITV
jgi:hypothetical protein